MAIILILVLSVVFFVVDLMIPLGVAGGVPHVVSILFSYQLEDRRAIPFFAILGSVLTILAFFFSPPGGEVLQVLANRFLALFVIWAVAVACMKIKSEKAKLLILTDAINQSPNPIAITDIDAKIEYVNSAFLQKTGYSEKELLGNTPRILKSGKHSEDFYRDLWETIRSGKIWKENIFNKRKNGTLYWESLQITPLRNAQGEITHFYSLRLLDKQMESVNKGLNTLSHTLDQVSQAVLMTDREGFIVYANPAFEKVTGYSLNEVLGMNPNVLKSGKQTPEFYEKLWKTITTGESWRGELFNKKKNGGKYWERAVISPVYDDENNISHFIAFRDDISEEKKKTDKLKKLSHIVEESPISILITDCSGNIEYANRSLLETSGYSLDEVLGKNTSMFKSGESPEKHYKNMWNRIAAGHDWHGVFHNKRKNGELYWESVLITSIINEEGNVTNYVALKENISEKKQLESTLIDHERLIWSVVNNLNDGLVIANVDGNIQLFNHGAEKIFGYKAGEVLDKPVAVLMDESYKEKHDVGFARFQKTHDISPNNASMEVVGTKKDGTLIPIELILTQMEQRGEVLVIGMIRDISERKEAEKQRKDRDAQLGQVLKGAKIYSWDWNIHTNKVIHDPRWVKFLGYSEGEIKSTLQQCMDLIHQDDLPKVQKAIEDHVQGKAEFLDIEYRALKKTGEWVWTMDRGKILEWDDDGKPLRAYGTYQNIQERKEAEKLIQESEGRFRTIFEENPLGVALIESHTGKILSINSKFQEITGRDEVELLKLDWMSITHTDDIQMDLDNMALVNSGKIEGFNMTKRYFRPDGSIVWINLTVHRMPVLEKESPIHLCMVDDITKRKEIEARVEAAQKQLIASEKLAGVGELAAGVSHEVLNPVNIISVHTQMLQRKTKDDANIQSFCIKVKHEIDRIQKIMGSLLAFSRKGDSELQTGVLRDTVEKVIELVEAEYKLDNIKILREWCGKEVEILFDPDKIRQVYLNLFNNAKHAMPEGGTITVGCAPANNKDYHQFTFSDTGTGMSEEVRLKIFEPFFTTKPEGQGTGLGMSIIHGIIAENGGKIRVASEEGKGATFTISLPVA